MPTGTPKNGRNKGWFGPNNPAPHTKEQHRKIAEAVAKKMRGRKHSEEHKAKISKSLKGKVANEANSQWKGERAGYMAIHNWVRRHWGTPKSCEGCGTQEDRMYHWANVSGRYERVREDWLRLCVPCHTKFDKGK